MKNIFTPEFIAKARQTKSVEELMALAKENGIEMTEKGAKANFELLNKRSSEISDEELDNINGGGGGCTPKCSRCGRELSFNPYNPDEWICDNCDR